MTQKTPKKIPRILKTSLTALLAIAASGGEIRTTPDSPVWQTGQTHALEIHANNSGVSPGPRTSTVDFVLENHPILGRFYTSSSLPDENTDFFGIADTTDFILIPGRPYSFRSTWEASAGPLVGQGNGSLVFYSFTIPENNRLLRTYHFTLNPDYTFMRHDGGDIQSPVTLASDSVTIIPNLAAMADATLGPDIPSNPNYDFDGDGDVDVEDWRAAMLRSSQERD